MKRTLLEVPQGGDMVKSVVILEDDPAPSEGIAGYQALGKLLMTLAEQPYLVRHASDCPSEIKIRHSGTEWVVETTTIYTRSPDVSTPYDPAQAKAR